MCGITLHRVLGVALSIVLNVVHAILYACCHARELTRIIGILLNFAFPHLKIAKFSRQPRRRAQGHRMKNDDFFVRGRGDGGRARKSLRTDWYPPCLPLTPNSAVRCGRRCVRSYFNSCSLKLLARVVVLVYRFIFLSRPPLPVVIYTLPYNT